MLKSFVHRALFSVEFEQMKTSPKPGLEIDMNETVLSNNKRFNLHTKHITSINVKQSKASQLEFYGYTRQSFLLIRLIIIHQKYLTK